MSSTWYCLTLSTEDLAAGKAEEYKEAFQKAFAVAHGPRMMALFKRPLDERLQLFFTPECAEFASRLLHEWGCEPCGRPSLVGLHLVVGHHEITYYMPD